MDSYYSPVVKAIARYGKASLRALPTSEGVNVITEIDFNVPIDALSIREYLNEFQASLLVPTGPWRVRPISFTVDGLPQKVRIRNGGTRWSLLMEPASAKNDLDQELVSALIDHVDSVLGKGCGSRFWTDFVIALCFHEAGVAPGIFSEPKQVLRLINQDYSSGYVSKNGELCPTIVPGLSDDCEDLMTHHAGLGEELKGHLFDAIEEDDVRAYNSDLAKLLKRADEAFAPTA